MSTIRAAIVGCGVIAPTHAACLRQQPDVAITWACDLIEERARRLAAAHAIPRTTTRYAELLAAGDVDLVCVCTDHASHAEIVTAALAAGKHVLCEKALAQNTASLEAILAAVGQHPGQVVSGVFQHRFDAINRRVRGLIQDGALGRMLTAGMQMRCLRTDAYYRSDTWRGTWDREGGAVLINQAIHYLDLLRWMMGGAKQVVGLYANLTHGQVIETEDTAVAALEFGNGALGTVEATCSSHLDWEPTLHFHGTRGSIELRHDRPTKVLFVTPEESARVKAELDACEGAVVDGPGKAYYGSGHAPQFADVIDAIRNRRAPFVTAYSAAETVDLVLGLYASFQTRQPVALPPRRA